MTDPTSRDGWHRAPDVAFVDDGERVVLLNLRDPREGRPRLLAGPAATVWRAIERSNLIEDVLETVAGQFGVPTDQIGIDVEAFLRALEGEGLVYRGPSVKP